MKSVSGWEITLKNFRKHKSKTIKLPLTGLILLHGRNGSGKSTILKAIYWCLYGGGNKTLVSYGETKSEVSIKYRDSNEMVTITRSRPPNRIVYKDNHREYEGEEAQHLINTFMNANSTLYNVGCYMRQRHKFNSIINASSSDQVTVIEELVDRGVSEKIIEKLKTRIKYFYSSIEDINKKLTIAETRLGSIVAGEIEKPDILVDREQLDSLFEEKKKLVKKLDESNKLFKDYIDKKAVIDAKKNLRFGLKQELEEFAKTDYESRISRLEESIKKEEAIRLRVQLEEELKLKRTARKHRLKRLEDEFDEEEYFNLGIQIESLEKQIETFENRDDRLVDRVNKMLDSISLRYSDIIEDSPEDVNELYDFFINTFSPNNRVVKCPCCDENIMVMDDYTIEKYRKGVSKKVLPIKKYLNIKEDLENISSLLEQIEVQKKDDKTKKRLVGEKSKLIEKYLPMKKKYEIINELKNVPLSESILEEKIKNLPGGTPRDNDPSKKKLDELYTIKNRVSYIKKILEEPLEEVITVDNLEGEIESLNKKMRSLDAKISSYTNYFIDSEKWREYIVESKKKEEIHTTLESLRNAKSVIESKLKKHEYLLQKTQEASVSSVSHTIDQLNFLANVHIKNLFDEEVEVELYNEKIDKVKLGIRMTVEGVPIEDYEDQVGGGQQQRCEFAYCFALNEISGSNKILSFDESFGAADPEAYLGCLNYIKKSMSDRLVVMISHHLMEGIFDHTISLD